MFSVAFNPVIAFLLVAIIFICLKSIHIVPQSEEWVIETFGKVSQVPLKAGMHFIVPLVSKVRAKASTKMTEGYVPPTLADTKDKITISIDAKFIYQVIDALKVSGPLKALDYLEVADYIKEEKDLNKKAEHIMLIETMNVARGIIEKVNLQTVLKSRESISNQLFEAVARVADDCGCKLYKMEISEIDLPRDIQKKLKQEKGEEGKEKGMEKPISPLSTISKNTPSTSSFSEYMMAKRFDKEFVVNIMVNGVKGNAIETNISQANKEVATSQMPSQSVKQLICESIKTAFEEKGYTANVVAYDFSNIRNDKLVRREFRFHKGEEMFQAVLTVYKVSYVKDSSSAEAIIERARGTYDEEELSRMLYETLTKKLHQANYEMEALERK